MRKDKVIYDWKVKLESHSILNKIGKSHLLVWEKGLQTLLANNVSIKAKEEVEYFEFEIIGLRFKSCLETNTSSFETGFLTTYLIEEDENSKISLIKCVSYYIDHIGNIKNGANNMVMNYCADLLEFIDGYITDENPIRLKLNNEHS